MLRSLNIQVPDDVDISGLEGAVLDGPGVAMIKAFLKETASIKRQAEADRVPEGSPLACAKCGKYRGFCCSLCPEQVCRWCHRSGVDHHGGKVRRLRESTKLYIMTDLETGALIPHDDHAVRTAEDSYFIAVPLPGPCLSCGHEGYKKRLLYKDPTKGESWERGVANEAICYACGAGDGNWEPVHNRGGALN